MNSRFLHTNFNVLHLNDSLAFYQRALGLREVRRVNVPDGSFIIVFLEDGETNYQLELTWLRDRTEPYDLGEKEFHLAIHVPDIAQARCLHEEMKCICFDNKDMGLYFMEDPDGYWIEILNGVGSREPFYYAIFMLPICRFYNG